MGSTTQDRLIRRNEVERRTGLSCSSIYASMAKGSFPRPVPLGTGQAVGWLESEIDGWIASRVAERSAR